MTGRASLSLGFSGYPEGLGFGVYPAIYGSQSITPSIVTNNKLMSHTSIFTFLYIYVHWSYIYKDNVFSELMEAFLLVCLLLLLWLCAAVWMLRLFLLVLTIYGLFGEKINLRQIICIYIYIYSYSTWSYAKEHSLYIFHISSLYIYIYICIEKSSSKQSCVYNKK